MIALYGKSMSTILNTSNVDIAKSDGHSQLSKGQHLLPSEAIERGKLNPGSYPLAPVSI
jgi:hypothetical protein